MKKLFLVLLLFTGMVNAQPPTITSPQNQTLSDTNNDNYELFLVYSLSPQILGSLNPNNYTIEFFRDAAFQNLISINEYTYWSGSSTIYVKVTENANPTNFATASFNIVLVPTPIIGQAHDIFQMDIPFDAVGVFDLTSQSATVLNGQTGLDLVYYPSNDDAVASTNPITNPAAYTNIANPQYVCAKVTNPVTGGYSISNFRLVLTSVETITIPDPILFSKLIVHDTNSDGLLQLSEALSVTNLDLSTYGSYQPFSDPTGLENFTNVTDLFLSYNTLTSLDASVFHQLNSIDCSNTSLTSINLNGLTHLKSFICDTAQLTSLDVSTCTSLETLIVARNQLSSLNISGLTGLTALYCNSNHLTTLDVSLLTHMTSLCCSDNALTSLDLTGLDQLVSLCYGNQSMAAVDISHLTNLVGLSYGGGLATTLNLNTSPNLQSVWAWSSNLTELDLSGLPLVNIVRLFSNNALTYVNMKNGGHFLFSDDFLAYDTEFQSNPNLFYVCTNDVDQAAVNAKFALAGANNGQAHAGTYCTFVPGGNYNTITGTIRFDSNNDGCDASDIIQPNIKVNINDGTTTGSTFIENSGAYHFYTGPGSFDITAAIENPSWFNISPAIITVPFANNNNNTSVQNFCLTSNGVHNDIEVVISPITPARPGFDATYKIIYRNKGNQTASGTIMFNYNDAVLDFISATILPNLQSTGLLTWNYADLLPFESRSFEVTLNLNSPAETPAVNNGDVLNFISTINPITGDENVNDNQFTFNQTVVGSHDPNDITCLEGNIVAPTEIGKYLHYAVNFENTGTAAAENVVVASEINPAEFDISSIQIINSSHDVYARITGNKIEFIFENINLAARTIDPPVGGHGTVLYKIKTRGELVANDNVTNSANIFFDYNFPVVTNDAETTFALLSNTIFELDESVSVYPNPTTSLINIKSENTIQSLTLYDVQGRVLESNLEKIKATQLDISSHQKGVYFLKITTDKGSKLEKIVKE